MSKLDQFKNFVKQHPNLITYVQKDEMTWQKFYEIYDLYGEDTNAWNTYINNNSSTSNSVDNNTRSSSLSFTDIMNMAKNIDVDKVQSGINSLQKALGLVGDLFVKDNKVNTNSYTPRPLYRSFED